MKNRKLEVDSENRKLEVGSKWFEVMASLSLLL